MPPAAQSFAFLLLGCASVSALVHTTPRPLLAPRGRVGGVTSAATRTPLTMSKDAGEGFYPFPSARGGQPQSYTALHASKEDGDSSARQLLGMKGASGTTELWKIRLQLTKPVTWIPLMWGVACGAAASGNYHTINFLDLQSVPVSEWGGDLAKAIGCMVLAGPLLTGFTQTLNDYLDREIDAINEPYRPIPSGAIKEDQVITQILVLLAAGLAVSYGLDIWAQHEKPTVFGLSCLGTFISYIYSAPPLKLKQNGFAGSYALGSSYIALPWLCGQAMFGELSLQSVVLTLLYSFAGLGIAIVNDFKSIEGDRAMGLQSMPVMFGVDAAKYIAAASIDVTQLGVAAYLYSQDKPVYAAILLGLVLPQMFFQYKFLLPDPLKNDVKYQAAAQPFLVLGILDTALAVGKM